VGIESDQVVYEYLSRVGDVAQQQQLSSATRMRLVSELRNEIDRRRAKAPVDSPAAVRRIIDRLGSPDVVVAAAGGGDQRDAPAPSVPVQRDGDEEAAPEPPKGFRKIVPRPRPRPTPPTAPSDIPSPPHRAGAHELGDSATRPDWWRGDRPTGPLGFDDEVPGFVGGVEIPDLLKAPPAKEDKEGKEDKQDREGEGGKGADGAPDAEGGADSEPAAKGARRRLLPLAGRRWSNPLLLIAAGSLLAGAVLGNPFALLLGWLIAYASRRLTDRETKWAVMVLPGAAVAAGLVWLWGRTDGRWGDPITEGQMNDAIQQTWPWVVRGAAVASALFLVWRSQRRR
jgi:hypothetical protein